MADQAIATALCDKRTEEDALRLLKNIAAAANSAIGVESTFAVACEEILAFTGWAGGVTFLLDGDSALRVSGLYGSSAEMLRVHGIDPSAMMPDRWIAGSGIPGRVLASKRYEWATDDDFRNSPQDFPKSEMLLRLGIKCIFAFPIMVLDHVVGVLAFFAMERAQPDAALLALMADIGVQLGRAVEREQAETQRRRLCELLDTIINSMPSVLIAVDGGCRVIEWNSQAEGMTSIAEKDAIGRLLEDVLAVPHAIKERIRHTAGGGVAFPEQRIDLELDGETRLMEVTIYPLFGRDIGGAVLRLDDVTRRVRMEQLVVQSQKVNSMGALAAGMAHEINNPLAGMVQNAQVVLMRTQADVPANRAAAEKHGTTIEAVRGYLEDRSILEMLEAIRSSGARVSEAMRNMLSFARPAPVSMQRRDIRVLIEEAVVLAKNDHELRKTGELERAEVIRDYDAELPRVLCYPSEIQQVILNLLKNAAQMGGEEHPPTAALHIVLRAHRDADNVRVTVEDDGPGMTELQRKKIFEPFCTTNDPNKSNGLALSVAYFIVTENHHGTLTCDARPGGGTVFSLILPIDQPDQNGAAGEVS